MATVCQKKGLSISPALAQARRYETRLGFRFGDFSPFGTLGMYGDCVRDMGVPTRGYAGDMLRKPYVFI